MFIDLGEAFELWRHSDLVVTADKSLTGYIQIAMSYLVLLWSMTVWTAKIWLYQSQSFSLGLKGYRPGLGFWPVQISTSPVIH